MLRGEKNESSVWGQVPNLGLSAGSQSSLQNDSSANPSTLQYTLDSYFGYAITEKCPVLQQPTYHLNQTHSPSG
ncbi:hypothetical protein RSAG8_02447, partial [Rhizoctonia solani AG-8 WAC10335]